MAMLDRVRVYGVIGVILAGASCANGDGAPHAAMEKMVAGILTKDPTTLTDDERICAAEWLYLTYGRAPGSESLSRLQSGLVRLIPKNGAQPKRLAVLAFQFTATKPEDVLIADKSDSFCIIAQAALMERTNRDPEALKMILSLPEAFNFDLGEADALRVILKLSQQAGIRDVDAAGSLWDDFQHSTTSRSVLEHLLFSIQRLESPALGAVGEDTEPARVAGRRLSVIESLARQAESINDVNGSMELIKNAPQELERLKRMGALSPEDEKTISRRVDSLQADYKNVIELNTKYNLWLMKIIEGGAMAVPGDVALKFIRGGQRKAIEAGLP